MKKSILFLFVFMLANISAKALDASITYATFMSETGNYVEVYLHVAGKTAEFFPADDGQLKAVLNVVILFKQGDKIIKFDKYQLNSPLVEKPVDFVDLKRFALENGHYDIEVSVEDGNRADNARKYVSAFDMQYEKDALAMSDIQLLASAQQVKPGMENSPMVKSGYYLESLPTNFYDKYANLLIFYNEVYNSDKIIGDNYSMSYYIKKDITVGEKKAINIQHKRMVPEPVTANLLQMDISKLESGNYIFTVEIRNRDKVLLAQKSLLFQRSNPYLNATREDIAKDAVLEDEFVSEMTEEELRYSLKAIAMQVGQSDGELMNTIIKQSKVEAMKLYLFSYWANRKPADPKGAYDKYMAVAKSIDEKFRSHLGYGFQTDRGFVYMKYGVPNDVITVEDDPSAPPYEIWYYNQFPMTKQDHVRFLFYNPSLATNGFVMLHSNARGEINNPRWEIDLYSDAALEQASDQVDGTRMQDNIGRQARRLFEGN